MRETAYPIDVDRLERSLLAMAVQTSDLWSWSLSRVNCETSTGPWTHVWEQEFDDVDAMFGADPQHPCIWTRVERWFDSEIPGSIVEPGLVHVFRQTKRPVLPDTSVTSSRD